MTSVPSLFDAAIVGGGIVGLAAGMSLARRFPDRKFLLLEKEPDLARHQSGHNSGVIHSGIYYHPGSLKATLCREGRRALLSFCERQGIPYRLCGKVIVATDAGELPRLKALYQRGLENGLQNISLIGPERLRDIEPHAAGIKAIHVPEAGLVDFAQVAHAYAEISKKNGAEIRTSAKLFNGFFRNSLWILQTTAGDFQAKILINCGGLHSDRIAASFGAPVRTSILPFRGEYYEIVPERSHLVRALVYPLPHPLFPFLGVHLTRTLSGKVKAGPNAVLALKREGYRRKDIDLRDMAAMLGYPGFWRMTLRYGRIGVGEWLKSFRKETFVRAVQRLIPDLTSADLTPGPSGVRAQVVNLDGSLEDDFKIVGDRQALHVLNVPSPAATASLRIGEFLAEKVKELF